MTVVKIQVKKMEELEITLPFYAEAENTILKFSENHLVGFQKVNKDLIAFRREVPITTKQDMIDFSEFVDRQEELKDKFDGAWNNILIEFSN